MYCNSSKSVFFSHSRGTSWPNLIFPWKLFFLTVLWYSHIFFSKLSINDWLSIIPVVRVGIMLHLWTQFIPQTWHYVWVWKPIYQFTFLQSICWFPRNGCWLDWSILFLALGLQPRGTHCSMEVKFEGLRPKLEWAPTLCLLESVEWSLYLYQHA